MEPQIVTHAPLTVIGIEILTKPMSPEIPALWPRFVRRIAEISPILEPGVSYGVMQSVSSPVGALSYLAAVSVADAAARVPQGMTAATLAGGRYAVFTFPLSGIASAFDCIFAAWLPSSGFSQVDAPIFERYGEDFDPADPASPMEVHIPIRLRDSDA